MSAHGRTIPVPVQRGVIESFAYMDFLGDIDLKKPDVVVGVFEEYVVRADKQEKGRDLSEMRRVWMGRKVNKTVYFWLTWPQRLLAASCCLRSCATLNDI